ncbi:hypothetical protein PGT21_036360 [Puccinia graminis f. sp. tritici]|uniref:Uncharacterized protein n=1 Tax=Puccinia graminis f. sp. tritici TaxID=56615 RepID=A0A5B0R333_PUCGR|nr:hypothetical protein PGT21_036360 [Puccinia graminis f. sp. tritici]
MAQERDSTVNFNLDLSRLSSISQRICPGPVPYIPSNCPLSCPALSTPPFPSRSSTRLSAYPPIFSTISPTILLDDGIRKLIIPCTGRASILDSCPGLLNLPIFDGLLIFVGLKPVICSLK